MVHGHGHGVWERIQDMDCGFCDFSFFRGFRRATCHCYYCYFIGCRVWIGNNQVDHEKLEGWASAGPSLMPH